jgi:hypothetical protein
MPGLTRVVTCSGLCFCLHTGKPLLTTRVHRQIEESRALKLLGEVINCFAQASTNLSTVSNSVDPTVKLAAR